jgi:hypothetical protein
MVLLVCGDGAFHKSVANQNYWFIFGSTFQWAESMKTRLLGNFIPSPVIFITTACRWHYCSGDKQYQAIVIRICQLVICLSFVLSLGGCGSPYTIEKPNPYYSANTKITSQEKHVWKVVELDSFQEALFVRGQDAESFVKPYQGGLLGPLSTRYGEPATWAPSVDGFNEFIRSSFENIGYFKTVKFYSQLEESPGIQKENHLIADYIVDSEGYYYTFQIRITNPKNNEVLFHVSHDHYRWGYSMDRPLFFPVFNSVIDWIKECTGSTELGELA